MKRNMKDMIRQDMNIRNLTGGWTLSEDSSRRTSDFRPQYSDLRPQTSFLRQLMLLLLLVLGSAGNGAWADDFTFHIREKDGTTDITTGTQSIADMTAAVAIPTSLKRHYCEYSLYYYDGDNAKQSLTENVSTYQTVSAAGRSDIYAEFELSNTCPITFSTDFEHATWYNMRFSDQNADTSVNDYGKGKGLQWFQYFTISSYVGEIWTNVNSNSDRPIQSIGDSRAYFAFIGNPYAFKVINLYGGSTQYAKLDGNYIKFRSDEVTWTWDAPTSTGHFKIVFPDSYNNVSKDYWDCDNSNYDKNNRIIKTTTSSSTRDIYVQPALPRVTFHVLRGLGGEEVDQVTAALSEGGTLVNPYTLNSETERPNCSCTTFYSDAACQNQISTLPSGVTDIYTPFVFDAAGQRSAKQIEFSSSFANAKWMNLSVVGRSSSWLQVDLSDKKLKKNDSADGTECKSQFAFIGDPYSFRIVSRELGDGYDLQSNGGTSNTSDMLFKEGTSNAIWTIFHPAGGQADRFRVQLLGNDYNTMWDSENPVKLYHQLNSQNDEKSQTGIYTYHVITQSGKDVMKSVIVADANLSSTTLAMPDALKRKFISEYKLYYLSPSDGTRVDLTQTDAQKAAGTSSDTYQTLASAGITEIYVDYVVSGLPFTPCTSYADADARGLWYNMHMGSATRWQYDQKPTYQSFTNKDNATDDERASDAFIFAFVGDPYELKIINRNSGGNYYIGVPSGASNDANVTYSDAINNGICTWEIVDDPQGTNSYTAQQFVFRQFNTADDPRYLYPDGNGRVMKYRNQSSANFGWGKTWVEKAPIPLNVTYEVHDAEGRKLCEATVKQVEGSAVSLPASLQRMACVYTYRKGTVTGDVVSTVTESMTVYVTYTVDPSSLPFQLSTDFANAVWYNMQVPSYNSGAYWFYLDSGGSRVSSKKTPSDKTAWSTYFAFAGDPYDLHIYNLEAGEIREAQWGSTDPYSVLVEFLPQAVSGQWGLVEPLTAGTGRFSVVYQPTANNTHPCYITGSTGLMNLSNTRTTGAIEYINARNADCDLHVQSVTKAYYSLTYKVFDDEANFVLNKTDYYQEGDPVTIALPEKMKRAFCNYSELYDTFDGTSSFSNSGASIPTTMPARNLTYYVTYTLTAKGEKVFSESLSAPKWIHIKEHFGGKYVRSDESGIISTNNACDETDNYQWCFVGTPYGFNAYNKKSGKYLRAITISSKGNTKVNGAIGETNAEWETYFPVTAGRDCDICLKGTWRNTTQTSFYANDQNTIVERSANMDYTLETSLSYTYHIVDNIGRVAISCTRNQFPGTTLGYTTIPEAIRSPYIADETLTFYTTATQRIDGGTPVVDADGRKVYDLTAITTVTPAIDGANIYVRYTNTHLMDKPLHLRGVRAFNIKVNGGHYMYDNAGSLDHEASTASLSNRSHLWHIKGLDPYAVEVPNLHGDKYLLHSESPSASLNYGTESTGRSFILMQYADYEDAPTNEVIRVELMAATGADLGGETPAIQYSVGAEGGTPGLYANVEHGDSRQKLLLTVGHIAAVYDIVDKQGKIVLAGIANTSDAAPSLPDEWKSPLVKEYHYWITSNFNPTDLASSTYTLMEGQDEITSVTDALDGHIYVTYDVITDKENANYVDLNPAVTDYTDRVRRVAGDDSTPMVRNDADYGTMYMLEFLNGVPDYLENGSDEVETTTTKPVYPYNNGDGQMYIYGSGRWNIQSTAGASTRTRWPWYLLAVNNDPYHVMVTSWQNTHARGGTNYYGFLRTYYNTTINQVITTTVSDDPKETTDATHGDASAVPTHYMLLGVKDAYKLVTTAEVNGSHQTVNSFEQYWKTYETVTSKNTYTLPEMNPNLSHAQDAGTLHSYGAWVNARPDIGGGDRSFEYRNHWYQTISMGDGTFKLNPTEIDAVLVLTDNHGWEIMRHPIAKYSETAKYETVKEFLRKYDSPMVSQYNFYGSRNVTHKVSGYHKYNIHHNSTISDGTVLRKNDLVGTGASLADYPQKFSGGALYDLYVTYDVKPEYTDAYTGSATGGTPQYPFLIRQGSHLAKTTDDSKLTLENATTTIDANDVSSLDENGHPELYWYLKPNFDIDTEMGYLYDVKDADGNTISKDATNTAYHANGKSGFDPYNIQIYNDKNPSAYFTTNAKAANIENHQYMVTTAPAGEGELLLGGTPSEIFTASVPDYDSKTLHVTNATFMAVQDVNGNMRLMPRFDHSRVVSDFGTLVTPADAQPVGDKAHSQTTWLLRPVVYTYIIIDNSGKPALSYKTVSTGAPEIPAKFASPLATDFKYYKEQTLTNQITGSFSTAGTITDNTVYVRYSYNPAADTDGLLKGTWYHARLNDSDVKVTTDGVTKDIFAADAAHRWRFMQSAGSETDPYAVSLWNGTPATESSSNRYIIMAHSSGNGYALMQAGNNSTSQYYFLDGSSTPAITEQSGYVANGTIDNTKQLTLTPVLATSSVTFKMITNTGHVALTSNAIAVTTSTDLGTILPEWMKSPLMANDAYTFYSSATNNGDGTYTLGGIATTSPMTLDDGTVYVRYDYEQSKIIFSSFGYDFTAANYATAAPLDLSGHVPYVLTIGGGHNFQYVKADGSIQLVSNGHNLTNQQQRLNNNVSWLLSGNDPYEVTLVNPAYSTTKVLSAKAPTTELNESSTTETTDMYETLYMKEPKDAEYTYQTFMILKGKKTGLMQNKIGLKLYVTGYDRLFVSENGQVRLWKDNMPFRERWETSSEPGNRQHYGRLCYRPNIAYHVITNEGKEAIVAYSCRGLDFDSKDAFVIPAYIQSPLIRPSDFIYYSERPTWDGTKLVTNEESLIGSSVKTIPDAISLKLSDIYIRYTYDPETSPLKFLDGFDKTTKHGLDLSGKTWYTMATAQNSNNDDDNITNFYTRVLRLTNQNDTDDDVYYGNYTYKSATESFSFDNTSYTTYYGSLSHKKMLWRLEGNDPYAIKIRNAFKGTDRYLSAPAGTGTNAFKFTKDSDPEADVSTFMYLNIYSGSNGYGATLIPTGRLSESRTLNNSSSEKIELYKWSTSLITLLGTSGTQSTGTTGSWLYFYKAPATRRYHYHAYNQTKGEWTWDAVLENDFLTPVVLDDQIARLYSKYEQEYLTSNATTAGTFKTRTELEALNNAQFYSNPSMTQRVFDNNSGNYDVYPEIEETEVYDIYFKYQPDTVATVSGLTLGDITSTAAEVAADVAYRKAKGQIDEEHLKNDVHANWYYMVLDTDYDLTATGTGAGRTFTGKQRFLRREDNGTVGWMDNAYALHYQKADNLNNWSYNRLAESYRQGENDAFREGRWLWTFMGDDPYNLRVLNLETAVGVTATGKGVYTMPAADDCWTTITKQVTETRDNKGNVTGTTTSYPVTVPTERPAEGPAVSYTWGIMRGNHFGSGEQTFNLVSTAMTEERDGVTMNLPLCWQMVTNETTKADSVAAMTRTNDRQNAIRLLKYEPMKYQDVNLVVKRDDHVAEYKTWKAANEGATADAKRIKLKSYDSGISLLYYTASERAYAAGDLIDMSRADALPLNVRRAFCTYKVYSDDFENEGGIYTVKDGPYPYKAQQATTTGKWTETPTGVWEYEPGSGDLIVDEDGRAVYPYINEDGTPALGGAQSLYAQYTVTSDVFLKTAPTKTEVAAMAENNDHVYFMDFPDTKKDGSDDTHHAFFDTDAKFRIQTGDLSKKVDKKSGTWRTEKRVWDGAKFVDDTATPYNYCQFRTTDNRMISVPEHLKWYFVGDPYRVQVFNAYENAAWNETEITDTKGTKWAAGTKAANLARFSTVETNFQFVVDCVHLQVPDYTNIDNRPELYPTDEMGNRLDPIPNRNEGKPYYNDFYWECVPTVSDDPNAFALRFKEDNDLLGYRNVYYYLAHEGLTKQYRQDGDNVTYHINLNYKADNEQYTSGDYIGYHKANDQNTVIRLVQPVKVYVSANRQADSRYDAKSNVTTDELSEYYGLGETVEEVPRHLQRKFVSYEWTPLELTDANKYSSTACTDHASDVFVSPNDVNYVFKRTVNYTVDDLTDDDIHLFSSCGDPANPLSTELQWLDVMIGNNNWLYYDKTNVDAEGNENQTTLVSNYARALSADKKGWYGTANGWTDGLKGLHWAFIGDPYDFTVVNRRRFEDGGGTGDQWLQSSDNLVMTATAGSATHYATKMWKTGGDSEYILTTKDIAKRMVAQKSTTEFRLMDHQLTDRRIYTANENDLNYENYVVNGYCYNPALAGLGGMQQKLQIRTAVAKDEDHADNDCFDTGVRIYSATGIRRIEIDDMEIKYGKAGDVLPISLRRYGCTYDCYLVTDGDSVKIDDFDAATTLTSTDANINGKTFREFVATGTKFHLSYVYNVENDAAQFFTSTSDAMTEDYTWMNTYFSWDQYYSGTNVEVEYYEREFDHYVYNAQGAIIDEVYNMIRRTKVDPNPQQAYPTTAYLNSHTGQSNIYANEGTQSEKDRQKWSLVGDPYEFTMKNYAQYLVNGSSVLTMDGKNVSSTNNAAQSQNFAIAVDKSGNTYLAIVGDNGQILQCITFEFSTTSDKELFSKGTGTNQHDPTGNTLDTKDVKPFKLANLIRYADILQYHLVIAHQHSLDHNDELSNGNAKILKDHLLEYLKYQGIRKNVPGMYVNSDVSDYLAEKKDEITTLLKKNASLRDFISYPIEDYSVSRVGIGNHPQVPWYMKRQFCRYYLYQRDVLRSVTLDGSFDYDGDGVVGDEGDIKLAYKKDENGNYLDEDGNITTDPEKRVQLWIDKANNKPAYEITWESIDNKTFWDAWNTAEDGNPETGPNKDRAYKKSDGDYLKKPKYYDEAMALNGKVLDKLQDCHFNRKVKIDVVYEVIPEEFQFATRGRNTTAWYQMMTNNDADGLMNFTYKNGIGARLDRIEHYTNNYLWAPEGDPYGFVLRSRYATINGTGWDNVAVTTKGHLPKSSTDPVEADYTPAEIEAGAISKFQANYTNEAQFDDKRIIHKLKGEGEDDATSDGPSNAVYEMFTGNAAYTNSFLMHPTSAYINTADTDFESYYMTHDTKTNISKLVLTSGRALQTNADANWSLHATAEQLLPYFERAGYVGGLDPKKATDDFSYHDYYEQLKAAKKNGTRLDFATLRKIQDIVYEGTFYQNDGTTEVMEGSKRPDQEYLPMKFKAANLVNMAPGYYRIKAFSEDALNYDGEDMSDTGIKGIIGPRYISAYRFESEKVDNPSYPSQGGRWLHFNETDMKHATIHTYADLKAKITDVNAAVSASGKSDDEKALLKDRDVFDHAAMHGNIEILPADFDPSSIFYFTEANATYGQYSLATQGLQLRARPGGTQAEAGVIDDACGHTEMVDATSELKEGYHDVFRLDDIGGAAVTLRTFDAAPSGTAWDTEVKTTLTTNYVCIDGHHRYRITCHKGNEMVEVGDHYTTDGLHGIQDTKWLLQPVGIREQWPYNEMPLRVEVQKGGVDKSGNEDNHYYGSLYVPFDTRLGNPADAAFTLTTPTITDATTSVTMSSVSQLNEMGNPQFVPANWPVVVRTTNVKNVVTQENQDGSTYATRHYVNMYIPNATPTTIPNTIDGGSPAIKLKGQLLEKTLTSADLDDAEPASKTIMVFGLPFDNHADNHHEYDTGKQVGWYTNDNWARETYSDYKAHDGSYPTAATVATHTQRSNKYVYHNKVYYVLDKAYEAPSSRHIVAIFDGVDDEEQRPIDITDKADTPWPCDVYDTAGRRVAENETPSTLLKNHPALRRGVYIFGGRKVVVK